jgi:multiple sugar transport system ATP-binding protein
VFQSYALNSTLDVAANVGHGPNVRGIRYPEWTERVGVVVRVQEIADLLAHGPRALSGGQRKRVALGRAMARKLDIFLMDEPFSYLDATLGMTLRGGLKSFHLDLKTLLISMIHDQLEARTMSDLVAMADRKIVQHYATSVGVNDRPSNVFVAGFIASPPRNFTDVKVVSVEGAAVMRLDRRTTRVPGAVRPHRRAGQATQRFVWVAVMPSIIGIFTSIGTTSNDPLYFAACWARAPAIQGPSHAA